MSLLAFVYVGILVFVTLRRTSWGPFSSYPMFRARVLPAELTVYVLEVEGEEGKFRRHHFPYQHQAEDFDSGLQRLYRKAEPRIEEWLRLAGVAGRVQIVELTIKGRRVVHTQIL